MKEFYEFRIIEEYADQLFDDQEGVKLGGLARKITMPGNDPRLPKVGQLDAEYGSGTKKPRLFFAGWHIHRRYTKQEIASAELFHLMITACFEPVGEECGTQYVEGSACPECGAGKQQLGPLRLDLRKAPKSKDIARTLADEWIVSQRLAELLIDAKFNGFELRQVVHKARYEDDPVDLKLVPTGRKLIDLAEASGIVHSSSHFYVWINREEIRPLMAQARAEYAELKQQQSRNRGKPLPIWYQLIPTSRPTEVSDRTITGNKPFDYDPENKHRCSCGDLIGLNLLSEVFVERNSYDGSDLVVTRQFTGLPNSWLLSPSLLISPRFRQLLLDNNVKGWKTDVAHLV